MLTPKRRWQHENCMFHSEYQLFTKIGEKYGIVCISAAGKDNIKQKILLLKSEKVLVIADGAAFGPQMNDIYRLMQEDSTKFSLYLPEFYLREENLEKIIAEMG